MSEAKHTPGPWWDTESGVRDRGGYICHTRPAQRYPDQDERFEKETQERAANKRLIAAAPDLLEACQAIIKYDEGDPDDCAALMLDYASAVEAARAAIGKATGDAA